jgi:hypothetical protein
MVLFITFVKASEMGEYNEKKYTTHLKHAAHFKYVP